MGSQASALLSELKMAVKNFSDPMGYDPGTGDPMYNNTAHISVLDVVTAASEKKRLESYK